MSNSVLQYDKNAPFRIWLISEIYQGPNIVSTGQYVPKKDDLIADYTSGFYRVTAVDDTPDAQGNPPTYTPTLESIDFSELTQISKSGFKAYSSYMPSAQQRCFFNSVVIPYVLTVDTRFRIYGSQVSYAKVFLGTDLSENGSVISQYFSGSGSLVSENIPLTPVDQTNPAIQILNSFNTSALLLDGEVITCVFYDIRGVVCGMQEFLIVNTNAIRGIGQNTTYITGINLVSNLLDTVTLDLINVPANVPIVSYDFRAEIVYSDGSSDLIPVGTAKCKLFGLDNFNTGLQGVTSKVTLTYYLDANEQAININSPINNAVSHVYGIRTIDNVNEFSFKVYVVPTFNNNTNTYSLDFYLTNVNYNLLVKLNPSQYVLESRTNNQIDYSAHPGPQQLTIAVNISSIISVGYTGFTFVQTFTINLGAYNAVDWLIDYLNTSENVYGENALFEFSTTGQGVISIKSNQLTLQSWLATLWTSIHAIYDQTLVLGAPDPTHFQLSYNNTLSPVYSVTDYWNLLIPNTFNQTLQNNSTMVVIWLYSAPNQNVYQTIGVSAVPLVNTLT